MFNISKIKFSLEQLIGTVPLILLNARPTFEYANGVKTENILGTTYTVVMNGGTFEKFDVKVSDTETAITADEIRSSDGNLVVEFENPVCRLYTDNSGHIQVSVKADSITVL